MNLIDSTKILTLQPFYGGSHKYFIDQWMAKSRFQWELMALPARHWKWRMRHAALEFARQISEKSQNQSQTQDSGPWDAILCSDMMNIAELKGLLASPVSELPIVAYFHENQFEYPSNSTQLRDLHFGFTNFVSALAADQVWFNSKFNRDSFFSHLEHWLNVWPDFSPRQQLELIRQKSRVFYPPVPNNDSIQDCQMSPSPQPLHIVWAARWEHDKNPADLLAILQRLQGRIDFQISVLGQSYSKQPAEFDQIKKNFGDHIAHWGFLKERQMYDKVLATADVILSTANHEFFGISVIEAMSAGCLPILPNRLSYPELLDVQNHPNRAAFLFDSVDEAVGILVDTAKTKIREGLDSSLGAEVARQFSSDLRVKALDCGFDTLLQQQKENNGGS